MKTLSIIIPVYYNQHSLPTLMVELLKVEEALKSLDVELELVFVDDGSGDDSLSELIRLKELDPRISIVKLTRNFGAIQAVKTGLNFINGDCFMFLAADLQDPPGLILEMVQRWLNGSKYVICVRKERDDPRASKMFAALHYKMIRALVIKDFPEGGYDLALMDGAMLPYMKQGGKNINISLFGFWLGYEPDIIYYKREARVHGVSRWTFVKKVKYFFDSVLGFSITPIRLMSIIGLVVSVISFTYGITVVLGALIGGQEVPGFSATASLLSFLLGIVIVMLGLIGEYLWRVFDQTSDRPEAVIEKIYK